MEKCESGNDGALEREGRNGILSPSTNVSGRMRQTELERAARRKTEMEDCVRLCHHDKQWNAPQLEEDGRREKEEKCEERDLIESGRDGERRS